MSCCYNLIIRQIYCQNGTSRVFENTYTNVSPNSSFSLKFGYLLTFVEGTTSYAILNFSNSIYIPDINFSIPNGSFKVFDLPAINGTFRIYVAVRLTK